MRVTHLVPILAISAGIIAGGAMLAPVFAQNASSTGTAASTPSGPQWLSVSEVLERLEAAGYQNFEAIERKRNGYEVKAVDANGQRVEIYVDPVTGEVFKTEVKGDTRRNERDVDRRTDRSLAPKSSS